MKIAIDLGHGIGQDRGADGFITEESVINSVGNLVIAKLKALGHNVLEVRPISASTVSDSLIQRVDKANSNNVDLYISIHANAGGGRGTEVFTYRGNEIEEARNVLNNITSLGFVNRGIKSSNLYVINKTEAKAMLIEICFVDTKTDVDLYNSIGADRIADEIVKGLVNETVTVEVKQQVQPNKTSSVLIADLQVACNAQGYSSQTVDGIAGTNTLKGCPTLRKGSRGNITHILQELLLSHGYDLPQFGADSDFGNETLNAVISFQSSNGLEADGIVGKNTWRKLLNL